jgi:hypothetical protein
MGNYSAMLREKTSVKGMRMNTEVLNSDGATRSSVEAPVMGVERRGRVIQALFASQLCVLYRMSR